MAKRKSAREVAEILSEIYETGFGGKRRGRYQILRSTLRKLTERKTLKDTMIGQIAEEALELGYVVMDLGDCFSIVEEKVMLNYRKVTKSVLSKYLDEHEEE